MAKMHLRQSDSLNKSGFIYSACRPCTKNKERKKNKKKRDWRYNHQNEPEKACFQHEMAYADFEDVVRRTTSNKILHDKAFNIAKNPKFDGYQRKLASAVYNFFNKKDFRWNS